MLLAGGGDAALPFVKLADFGVSLLVTKVQTAQLQRASVEKSPLAIDPLEESVEVAIPGREWFDTDEADGELDGAAVGDADTADIPIAAGEVQESAPGQLLVSSGRPPAGDESVTIQGDLAHGNLGLAVPAAVANRQSRIAPALGAESSPRRTRSADSLAAPAEPTASGVQESVTQSGILIGTPMYMAPELWHSGSHLAQPSSDLFSFGVIAFELLTSVLPFLQPPVFAYAQKQPLRIASLATSRSELDARLSALVDACLSEIPAARPTARVVVDTLRELGAPTPIV